jgi:flagellar basal-body rod modification protein FlgD
MSTISSTASSSDVYGALNATAAGAAGSTGTVSADSFLKLLVTQIQNQDPLNPMDNAQMTSQLAQINTVTGIGTLNPTVQGLNSQFVQMQALQGAALVGKDVTLQGNGLQISGGVGVGGFTIAGAADNVKVDILDSAGRTVDTLQLGAPSLGTHDFSWPAGSVADGSAYSFKVTANSGAASVATTSLMQDRVDAVSTASGSLVLDLQRSGGVPFSAIQAFN